MTLGGAADRVFVEVEAEFVGASGGGRGVGRHVRLRPGGANGSFGEFQRGMGAPKEEAFNAETRRTQKEAQRNAREEE